MKKFKEIFEQHRKEGRFRPVKPHNVQNISLGSPRPSSDSASVKLKEDLRKWFSKTDPAGDWKRINSKGEAIGPCAREPGEPKPKCMSRAKRESLTKKERASAVRAKRKHDPNPERKGEPINVSNFGKGKISENMEKLNKNNLFEKWSQKYKSSIDCNNPKGFSQKAHCAGKEKNINEEKKDQYDEGEYDQEGDMAKSDLRSIMANAKRVHDMLEDSDNLPEWVQSKITKAEDYMSTVANYMEAEMSEEVEQIDEKNEPTNPSLWSRAKALARSKFDVYPSAYANGWASKWYKSKGGSWRSVSEEVDAAIGLAKPKTSLTPAAKTLAPQTRVAEASKPPFDKPYTTIKKVVTDKSGAKHGPMSRARDIARMAMKKQVEKMKQPVKESLDESRRMEIVREAMKVAKKKKETMAADDKYQSDPVLSSQINKT